MYAEEGFLATTAHGSMLERSCTWRSSRWLTTHTSPSGACAAGVHIHQTKRSIVALEMAEAIVRLSSARAR